MLPNFIIIGAARSGTTWLAKNLMLHPEVFVPRIKEVHFFDWNYDKGIEWYKKIFSGRKEKAIGEATPAYLYLENIAKLIYYHIPDVKIIVSLRNPIERAYSHYWNLVSKAVPGEKNYEVSFEEKLRLYPRLIDEGMYVKKLKSYIDLFQKENMLILIYDDLEENPAQYLKIVYEFLDVNLLFSSSIENQKVNAASTNMGRFKGLYYLHKASMRFGMYWLGKYVEKINRKKLPDLNINTKKLLLEKHFSKEISELECLLSRDLSAWRRV